MVNSHYIPQFILRHFCVNNNIQYCDIERQKVERRTTSRLLLTCHGMC